MNSIFSFVKSWYEVQSFYTEQQPGFDGGAFSGSIFIGFTYVIMACGFALELIYDREVCVLGWAKQAFWGLRSDSYYTLISLINMKSRLPILKNSTLYKKKSTPHVYWFLRLFPSSNPLLLEFCTSIFQKIPPSMFIPTSTFIREMRVLVWTIQPTGLNTCMHLYCCNFEQTWTRTHFFVQINIL